MSGDRVASARIVLGHVAPVPWPAPAAEAAIEGKPVDPGAAEAAGEAAVAGAKALPGNAYKIRLATVAVKRALLRAAGKGA
jgi:xanthine dehydrogenase YagS FAD-binding subunit